MRSNIFFPILILILIGCGLGSHFFESIFYYTLEIFIVGIIALVSLIVSLIITRGVWKHSATFFISGFVLSSSLIFGVNYGAHARDKQLVQLIGESVTVSGVVISDPEISGDQQRFTFDAETIVNEDAITKIHDRILVSLPQYPAVEYGDKILLTAQLDVPERFATEYGRMFAYDNFLRSQKIGYTMFAHNYEFIDDGERSLLIAKLFQWKHGLFSSLARYVHAPYESIARAMVFGDKSGIPDDMQTAFQKTGLIHIMVLSGYNITIIAVALLAVTRPLGKRFGIIISACAIILFLLMTGLTPTSLRAGIMGTIGLLALATYRRSNTLRALVLAAAIMAIANPFVVFESVSFQLSFMATLGLIVLSPLFSFTWITQTFGLREIIASTIATQLAVLPLLTSSIGMVSVIGIIMNLFVVPIVPIIMAGSIVVAVGGLVWNVIGFSIGIIIEYLLRTLVWLVTIANTIPVISLAHISVVLSLCIGVTVSAVIIVARYVVHSRTLHKGLLY